jgi:hypothetical protein
VSPDVCLRRTTRAAWQQIDDEMVLLIGAEQKLVGLNPVAARIWSLVNGSRTASDIAETLVGEFEGQREVMLADALSFLDQLLTRGLVEPV